MSDQDVSDLVHIPTQRERFWARVRHGVSLLPGEGIRTWRDFQDFLLVLLPIVAVLYGILFVCFRA